MKSKIKIEQHSLWEFLKDVQEAIQKGYVLDLETNEHFPQSYGSYYSATVVKDAGEFEVPVVASLEQAQALDPDFVEVKEEPAVVVEKTVVPVEPTEPVVKRTRKPKAEVVDAPAPE